jgi:RNA polymerase sigma factor (TIGR02999 family)
MNEVTQLLEQWDRGDPLASERLLPIVYSELRKLAAAKLVQEKPGQTLQATALVHEAYVRLVDNAEAPRWDNRRHFFAAAAEAMRRILVEGARRKDSQKRGGGLGRCDLDPDALVAPKRDVDLLALDEALERLAVHDPHKAKLVELRFFAGLSVDEAAEVLGVSPRTLHREWRFTRAWLRRELGADDPL